MGYDPFERGPFPVGVSTHEFTDDSRGRTLTVEAYYPATDDDAGRDLDPATQDAYEVAGLSGEPGAVLRQAAVRDARRRDSGRNVVLLCHGYSGHRRESTFMATHLASHGFVVASADYSGSTFEDIDRLVSAAKAEGRRYYRADVMPQLIEYRLRDLPFVLESTIREFDANNERAGITGASFGGWSSCMAPSLDQRIKATAPMCPSGGESPVYPIKNYARDALDFAWGDDVAALFMVADRDTWLPLYGTIELFTRAPGPRQMIVLRRADHNHFVDDIEFGHQWLREYTASLADVEAEGGTNWKALADGMERYEDLTPQHLAQLCWRGLCTAHMDAHLRDNHSARALLAGDIIGELNRLGIEAVQVSAARR